ncbi:NUDIX domain-containing protein [Candidatus Nomurabacteria bacterium]|nr:NUDIX domain-containing protein [Candidatus Nomurabacteria bacterium]
MNTISDVSYGVIPLRRVGAEWEVFMIHQYSRIGNNAYWVFPKGHAEASESPIEAATRELHEETGLTIEQLITEPTFSVSYSFLYDGDQVHKTVWFYVATVYGEPQLDPEEVKEAGWYDLKAAQTKLDYQDTKKLFTEVCTFILSPQMTEKLHKRL